MDISVFIDKSKIPTKRDLESTLGALYPLWNRISDQVLTLYPAASPEWSYPGPKYGWSFRIKDKKRVIIYLLPRDKYFKVAFVFGQKAFDEIMKSDISSEIKTALSEAKVYAEGRGIRIDVTGPEVLSDIRMLIGIKLR